VTRFAGYAALFDVADAAGDVIRRGAFARAIAEAGEVPLFWQHRPGQRIGHVEALAEDTRGLRVIARIDPGIRPRAANGLSFGYRARGFRPLPRGRLLEDIDLFEVSLVTHPLQFGARVHLIQ
jgi:HK97 family phage prohead protease